MSKKVIRLALTAMLFALSFPVEAQQTAKKVPLIGFLRSGSPSSAALQNEALRQGLRDLGYIDGKTIAIEYRYAEGKPDRLPELAAELVRLKVDVILLSGSDSIRAAKQPVRSQSLWEMLVILLGPGWLPALLNQEVTSQGSTTISPDLSGKRLELLKEVVPNVSKGGCYLESSSRWHHRRASETDGICCASVQVENSISGGARPF